MKHTLAILALIIFVMGWPLAAGAGPGSGDVHESAPPEQLSLGVPDRDLDRGDEGEAEFECHGDPHDLGGGFRGAGTPAGVGGPVPIWMTPVAQLIMQLL